MDKLNISTTSRTVEPSPALLFGFLGVLFLPKAHNPPIQEKKYHKVQVSVKCALPE